MHTGFRKKGIEISLSKVKKIMMINRTKRYGVIIIDIASNLKLIRQVVIFLTVDQSKQLKFKHQLQSHPLSDFRQN